MRQRPGKCWRNANWMAPFLENEISKEWCLLAFMDGPGAMGMGQVSQEKGMDLMTSLRAQVCHDRQTQNIRHSARDGKRTRAKGRGFGALRSQNLPMERRNSAAIVVALRFEPWTHDCHDCHACHAVAACRRGRCEGVPQYHCTTPEVTTARSPGSLPLHRLGSTWHGTETTAASLMLRGRERARTYPCQASHASGNWRH